MFFWNQSAFDDRQRERLRSVVVVVMHTYRQMLSSQIQPFSSEKVTHSCFRNYNIRLIPNKYSITEDTKRYTSKKPQSLAKHARRYKIFSSIFIERKRDKLTRPRVSISVQKSYMKFCRDANAERAGNNQIFVIPPLINATPYPRKLNTSR